MTLFSYEWEHREDSFDCLEQLGVIQTEKLIIGNISDFKSQICVCCIQYMLTRLSTRVNNYVILLLLSDLSK
jgi:hypothetical protein